MTQPQPSPGPPPSLSTGRSSRPAQSEIHTRNTASEAPDSALVGALGRDTWPEEICSGRSPQRAARAGQGSLEGPRNPEEPQRGRDPLHFQY